MHGSQWGSLAAIQLIKTMYSPNDMYHAPTDLHAVYTNSSY